MILKFEISSLPFIASVQSGLCRLVENLKGGFSCRGSDAKWLCFLTLRGSSNKFRQWPHISENVIKIRIISSPVQSTGRAIVVTLASALALALTLALPFPSRHF